MKNFKNLFFALFIAAFAMSCDDDESNNNVEKDYSATLRNLASNVIVESYADLASKAVDLHLESIDLQNDPTVSNFDAAKQAWRSTRSPWEQAEGFLYGPVDTQGIDPAIDSWPVNVQDMQNLLNDVVGNPNITESVVNLQVDEAKGFHLIEFLLWGLDGNKQLADFTTREYEYLVAACANLKTKTAELDNAWQTSGGNYVSQFLNAGSTGSNYVSQKSALEDIVDGLITIADEVANTKIEEPYNGSDGSGFDATSEESRFSHNSKSDFANNVRSISNIYNGTYFVDGVGLSEIVSELDAALDIRFSAEITTAIQAIEAIPGTFTDAIENNRTLVGAAQVTVRTVQETLENDVKPIITGL